MAWPLKPQSVRLLDVALIGPVMVIAATRLPSNVGILKPLLSGLGWATIAYNARNYALIQAGKHAE